MILLETERWMAQRRGAEKCSLMQPCTWLGGQDSNLDTQIQSLMAYR